MERQEVFSRSNAAGTGHPDVWYVQGVLCLDNRNWAQAQTHWKGHAARSSHARLLRHWGWHFAIRRNMRRRSRRWRSRCNWTLPVVGDRWTLCESVLPARQYDEALKMSQEALAGSNGKAPEIELLVAQALTSVGRYEDAAQVLREFLRVTESRGSGYGAAVVGAADGWWEIRANRN